MGPPNPGLPLSAPAFSFADACLPAVDFPLRRNDLVFDFDADVLEAVCFDVSDVPSVSAVSVVSAFAEANSASLAGAAVPLAADNIAFDALVVG